MSMVSLLPAVPTDLALCARLESVVRLLPSHARGTKRRLPGREGAAERLRRRAPAIPEPRPQGLRPHVHRPAYRPHYAVVRGQDQAQIYQELVASPAPGAGEHGGRSPRLPR